MAIDGKPLPEVVEFGVAIDPDRIKDKSIRVRFRDVNQQLGSRCGVRGLTWLILTDRQHVVPADGFCLDDLEAGVETMGGLVAGSRRRRRERAAGLPVRGR